ncbi:hypothetical protein IFM47457_00634 [Aspergillus lentulus]|nr:hypothetical protein IFM47457_00634 [Aspergillus lentulus]
MRYHEVKKAEVEKDLDGHVRYVDNAVTRHTCFEVYEELAKYLVQCYPMIFLLEGCATSFLVQDDLVQVIKNEASPIERRTVHHTTELDGQYHLDAAAVCRPCLAISGEIQRVAGHAAFEAGPPLVSPMEDQNRTDVACILSTYHVTEHAKTISMGSAWATAQLRVDRRRDPFSI